ncbi:hypothetical protein JZ751_024329 [Albula glossodonta]|uniref:Uncharacterized protein n=1 Tax=Albula glossodonta TaxID=121402 RepID=A0A8T2NF95_9TELE|nr:hypothetical protein JZ751_005381 [Albula glossodonta]KAG9338939.1 hypothetical protein JZ751_024329 [Albula glossodonta]
MYSTADTSESEDTACQAYSKSQEAVQYGQNEGRSKCDIAKEDTPGSVRIRELLQRLSKIDLESVPLPASVRRLQRQKEESGSTRTYWVLDPTEHAWMLSAVDGNFDVIMDYLSVDSSLINKKDYVTGFTVLHWLAKYGKHETLIKLLQHADKEGLGVNVNVKASGGFTPLHVAVMHTKYMVVKILVGAFGADVGAMDHSGRRPWQYLRSDASAKIKELLGAVDDVVPKPVGSRNANNSAAAVEHLQTGRQKDGNETNYTVQRTQRLGSVTLGKMFSYFTEDY